MFSVWNMIIAKSFMAGIPAAITESAKLEGANDFTIYVRLMIPLSKPLLATLALFSALAYWNDWYNCMLFMTDDKLFNLQYYLQSMLGSAEAMRLVAEKSGMDLPAVPLEGMKMAMTVIATGPIVLLYPFLQRYFVKGLTIGAVKG
jgi:putative aldouronate transport system permease protein